MGQSQLTPIIYHFIGLLKKWVEKPLILKASWVRIRTKDGFACYKTLIKS